jgi:carbamoyl-phosphate synthase/aspartate carbamoyltransferase
MSKGYRSRRMAVDFAVPLLTNVKCAKLFIEAISRRHALEISNVDSKSSHETIVLPGLVALGVHAPNLLSKGAEKEIDALSQAAIQSGFTTLQVLPVGSSARIVDLSSKQVAASQWATARCDFVHSLVATSSNQEELQGQAPVFLPLSERTKLAGESAMTLASCLDHVSSSQTVYSDASATELASLILLASLSNVKLHVTGVSREQDLELIKLARARKVQLTCDVTVQSLLGPSAQPALLANLDTIDCLSIGAPLDGEDVFASSLSLLLKAVQQGKLTTDDVVSRMATAPAKIFGLQAGDDDTRLEVELDRSAPLHSHSSVHRVVLRGKTVSLDGSNSSDRGDGQDAAGPALVPGLAHSRRKSTRFSVSLPSKPVLSSLAPDSPLPVNTRSPVLAPVSSVPREQFQGFRLDYDAKPSVSNNRLSSFPIETAFNRRHILTVKQFSRNDLHALFSIATEMRIQVERNSAIDILRGRVLCTLFYEPSTRTSTSFEAAMIRLGGGVTSVAVDRSSVVKGESLEDTIRTIGCYGDAIVLRHPEAGAVARGAKVSNLPVINAGDGTGEHPTQAMLDVYTIREELGTVNGLTVTSACVPCESGML